MHDVRRMWEVTLNLLYPPSCCACAKPTAYPGFCDRCRAEIEEPSSPLCPVCGVPYHGGDNADHICGRCLRRRPRFRQARACAIYDAADTVTHPLKSVLQRYKYNPDVGLARPLAELVVERCPLPLATYDVIIPVPLHVKRLRWRGFNQAQFLAHALARSGSVAIDALSLRRLRPTLPQVRLNEAERQRNVARAFGVVRPERVRGRHVLLIDDVYTTGATVEECSRALLKAGAAGVDVLVLARAVLR